MPRRSITDAEKKALAEGWAVARAAGETQDTYAKRHGTTARRVREYVAKFGVPVDVAVEARRIIADAMTKLRNLEQRLVPVDRRTVVEPPVSSPHGPTVTPKNAAIECGTPVGASGEPFQWDVE